MTQPLYDDLNKISDEEFQNITKETPLQEYFDISFQSNIKTFKERTVVISQPWLEVMYE